FFQAEDGIRDFHVTGVQTCALPILLAEVDIPKKYHGKVMNACFHFISDVKTAVAIKAFSLTLLDNLSRSYPEITRELNLVISERSEERRVGKECRSRWSADQARRHM